LDGGHNVMHRSQKIVSNQWDWNLMSGHKMKRRPHGTRVSKYPGINIPNYGTELNIELKNL